MTHFYEKTCLVLAVAALSSVTAARADYWTYDFNKGVVSPSDLVSGKQYLLQTGQSLVAGEYSFLSAQGYTQGNSAFSDANVFTLIATTEKDASGAPIYVMQRSGGEFLADPSAPLPYTGVESRAWKFAIKPAIHIDREHTYVRHQGEANEVTLKGFDAYAAEVEDKVNSEDFDPQTATYLSTDVVDNGVVLVAAKPQTSGNAATPNYLSLTSAEGTATIGNNPERNLWFFYEAQPLKGTSALAAAATLIQPQYNTAALERDFPVGKGGGRYDAVAYAKFLEMWNKALPVINSETEVTDAVAEQLTTQLTTTYAALRKSLQPITAGYYIFSNYRADHPEESGLKGGALYDGSLLDATENSAKWSGSGDKTPSYDAKSELSYEALKFIWEVIPAGSNAFYLRNYESKQYLGGYDSNTHTLTMSMLPTSFFFEENPSAPGYCSILSRRVPQTNGVFHAISTSGATTLGLASPVSETATGWHARPLTNEAVATLRAQSEQPALNNRLTQLLALINLTLAENRVFSPVDEAGNKLSNVYDNDFSAVNGLLTQKSQLDIPMLDPAEGNDLAALLDANPDTYIHTTYHSEAPWDAPHFLQVSLEKPVNGLTFKLRKRENGNINLGSPATVVLWGTNDEAALNVSKTETTTADGQKTTDYEAWKKQGWTKLNETNFAYLDDKTGFANFSYDGDYRYYRLEVVNKLEEPSDHERYVFASELRVYRSVYDKAASPIESVDENLRNRLTDLMKQASTQLQAGKAEQGTVEALEAAYTRLQESLPDVNQFLDVYTAFNRYLKAAKVASDSDPKQLGYYDKAVRKEIIAEYQRVVRPVLTKARNQQIPSQKEMVEAIQTMKRLYKEYQRGLNAPAEGVYRIKSGVLENRIGLDTYLGAANSSTQPLEAVRLMGTTVQINRNDTLSTKHNDPEHHFEYLWQLQKVEGGYTLRNLFSGLYLSHTPNRNTVVQSATPEVLNIYGAGDGAFNILMGDDNESLRYLRGAYSYLNGPVAVMSSVAVARDLSSFDFVAVDNADVEKLLGAEGEGIRYRLPQTQQYHIVTLPFAIDVKKEDNFFKVLGQDNQTKEIVLAAAEGQLKAGEAYILHTPKESEVTLYPVSKTVAERFAEATTLSEGTTLKAVYDYTLIPESSLVFNPSGTQVVTTEAGERALPNTGYFSKLPAVTVPGDLRIPADALITALRALTAPAASRTAGTFTLSGVQLEDVNSLPAGVYIVKGQKVIVK